MILMTENVQILILFRGVWEIERVKTRSIKDLTDYFFLTIFLGAAFFTTFFTVVFLAVIFLAEHEHLHAHGFFFATTTFFGATFFTIFFAAVFFTVGINYLLF